VTVMGHTVIQLPVPPLEPLVREHLASRVPPVLPSDSGVACAHITLLGPFVGEHDVDDTLMAELTDFFARVSPFDYELVDVRRFPDGTVYLAPHPEAPFQRLTEELAAKYPAWPPYGGAFPDVIPHVSLGSTSLGELQTALASLIPVPVRAAEAHLTWWSTTSVRTLARFSMDGATTESRA